MQIHSGSAYELIADAHQLGEDRPLILAGGAKAIFEPWDFFNCAGRPAGCSADVVVTGHTHVPIRAEHPGALFLNSGSCADGRFSFLSL